MVAKRDAARPPSLSGSSRGNRRGNFFGLFLGLFFGATAPCLMLCYLPPPDRDPGRGGGCRRCCMRRVSTGDDYCHAEMLAQVGPPRKPVLATLEDGAEVIPRRFAFRKDAFPRGPCCCTQQVRRNTQTRVRKSWQGIAGASPVLRVQRSSSWNCAKYHGTLLAHHPLVPLVFCGPCSEFRSI